MQEERKEIVYDHVNKCYVPKPEAILENKSTLWYLDQDRLLHPCEKVEFDCLQQGKQNTWYSGSFNGSQNERIDFKSWKTIRPRLEGQIFETLYP